MAARTRREWMGSLAGLLTAGALHGAEPTPTVFGVDHLKLRVRDAAGSAAFYHGLFGSDVISVRNSTLPDSPLVDEFFVKIGAPLYPFLMVAQLRDGESPGLDHLAFLSQDPAATRSGLERLGATLVKPSQGIWARDADDLLIELFPGPLWGKTNESMRRVLPANLRDLRPAFATASIVRLSLRVHDADRSARFYAEVIAGPTLPIACGPTELEFRRIAGKQTPGFDRLVIAIRDVTPAQARHLLQQRGVRIYGSRRQILFRDPDGHEIELVVG